MRRKSSVDDEWIFDLPDAASYEEGAAFLTTYLTAWIPLTRQVRLHPDSNVLVTAAAGGVGTAAIQVATSPARTSRPQRARRRSSSSRAGSAPPHGLVRGDRRARRHRRGVRPGRRRGLPACIKSLRPLGAAIGIGFAGGAWEPVDPARLVGRNVGVLGLLPRPADGLPARLRPAGGRRAARAVAPRALRPVVGAEFPLEQANEAQELIASRKSTGKVVLVP